VFPEHPAAPGGPAEKPPEIWAPVFPEHPIDPGKPPPGVVGKPGIPVQLPGTGDPSSPGDYIWAFVPGVGWMYLQVPAEAAPKA
jgi:hypothetical protein